MSKENKTIETNSHAPLSGVSERLFTKEDMMNAWRMSAQWHIQHKSNEIADGDGELWIEEYIDEQNLNAH